MISIDDTFQPLMPQCLPLRYGSADGPVKGERPIQYVTPEYVKSGNYEAITAIAEGGWPCILMCKVEEVPPRFRSHPTIYPSSHS